MFCVSRHANKFKFNIYMKQIYEKAFHEMFFNVFLGNITNDS